MTRPLARRLLAQAAAITMAAFAGVAALTVTAAPAQAHGGFGCTVSNFRSDTVNVRSAPSTSAGIVATLVRNDSAVSECHFHRYTGYYSCFGHPTDNSWVYVYEDGRYGYVGWRCVTGP